MCRTFVNENVRILSFATDIPGNISFAADMGTLHVALPFKTVRGPYKQQVAVWQSNNTTESFTLMDCENVPMEYEGVELLVVQHCKCQFGHPCRY